MEQVTTIENRVRDFLNAVFLQGDSRGLTDTLDLVETHILDSINVIRLVDFLEQEFDIMLKPPEIVQLTSISNIVRVIRSKLGP